MTNVDCIDSCIILGTIFKEDEHCELYIDTIGYKLKNKGLLTIPLIGEVFANLLLKVEKKTDDKFEQKLFMQNAVDFFDTTISRLIYQERLLIGKMLIADFQHVSRIKELDYAVTDDDALHVSDAINKRCQRFITTDKTLLNENFRGKIRKEFGLVISPPS